MYKTFEFIPKAPEPLQDMIIADGSVSYLSSCLDSFSGNFSITERGLRTPTYDEIDSVGVDVASDFHQNGFDRFEAVRDSSLATAERRVAEKEVKEFFKSRANEKPAEKSSDSTSVDNTSPK